MHTATGTTHDRHALTALLVLAVLLLAPVRAHAQEYVWLNGQLTGVWKTILTMGAAIRGRDADPQLVGAGAGLGDNPEFPGASGAVGVSDDAQLNFPKAGALVSAPMTLNTEFSLRHRSGSGFFIRVRAWYDLALKGNDRAHGNVPNVYTANSRISDAGFDGAAGFAGIDVHDAFFFGTYQVGPTRLALRVGRQAVDWGHGLFYAGINAFNPMDVAWATTTGARIANGGKLPVNRVFASYGGPAGLAFDGFVNLEFRPSVTPGCGTYFSNRDNGVNPGCNVVTSAGLPDLIATQLVGTKNYVMGNLYPTGRFPEGGTDTRPMSGAPSQWSGYGFSARKFIDALDTELGFYYTGYTSPASINAMVTGKTALEFSLNTMYTTGVKAWAVSAETGRKNLTMNAQLTRTLDFPAPYNAPAYITGATQGVGPLGFMMKECIERECQSYARVNTNQLQVGGTWQLGRALGMSNATLTAETDMQWNTNLPPVDGPDAIRIGRYPNFGDADWTNTEGYVCNPGPLDNGIVNKCEIAGFATPFAMGYKVRLQNTFPNVFAGVTVSPVVTFGHDITGYTVDQVTVVGGRVSLEAFTRFDTPRQKYFVEVGALWFRGDAAWDPLRDRGQYWCTLGINLR